MIMALIGLVPGLASLVQFFVGKAYDAKVQITMARLGCTRDVAVASLNTLATVDKTSVDRLNVFAHSKLLMLLLIGFAVPILLWFNKIVVYDNIWCPYWYGTACMTLAIKGEALEIMKAVVYFLFGAPTAVAVAHIFNRSAS